MTNPKAGHTSGTGMSTSAEGLRDGDGLSSPSLTNLYEGLHGNGIIRLADTAAAATLRNSVIASTPGYIEVGASGALTIHGGHCVLDGVLYKFAGGPGGTQAIVVGTSGTADYNGELPAVPTATSDVFVVVYISSYPTPSTRIRYEIGTPVAPSAGTPLIPSGFLSDPSINDTRLNHQSIVLAVLRYTLDHTAGNLIDALNDTPVLHDRRVYIRNSPMYLQHVTEGQESGSTHYAADKAVNDHTLLAAMYSGEGGDLTASSFGALWQSHTRDAHGMLYYAAPYAMGGSPVTKTTYTHRLGPDEVKVAEIATSTAAYFDGPNKWIVTTTGTTTFTPTGTLWPPGHIIEIYHKAGNHDLNFIDAPAGSSTLLTLLINKNAKFIFDGTNWHVLNHNTVG